MDGRHRHDGLQLVRAGRVLRAGAQRLVEAASGSHVVVRAVDVRHIGGGAVLRPARHRARRCARTPVPAARIRHGSLVHASVAEGLDLRRHDAGVDLGGAHRAGDGRLARAPGGLQPADGCGTAARGHHRRWRDQPAPQTSGDPAQRAGLDAGQADRTVASRRIDRADEQAPCAAHDRADPPAGGDDGKRVLRRDAGHRLVQAGQ